MNAVLALFDGRNGVGRLFPGLALTALIAGLALMLRSMPGLSMMSPLMLAVLAGMVLGNLYRLPSMVKPGLSFAARRVLRLAIVLLGFQLSASQIVAVGLDSVVIVASVVALVFLMVVRTGLWLGVDSRLAGLLAAGTSICGASAVAAMSSVNRASEEDVAYAMGAVTVFGTILMFALPVAAVALGLDARAFGIWAGASIHEVAQVTSAAFQFSDEAGEVGVVVKLVRVLMLAPVMMACGFWLYRRADAGERGAAGPAVPLFVLGFVLVVGLNSVIPLSPDMRAGLMMLTTFLMAMALAALGLQTSIAKLKAKGIRPLALGALGTIFVAGLSLGLIEAAQRIW